MGPDRGEEARSSLPDVIRCTTEALEHLEQSVAHLQRVCEDVSQRSPALQADLEFLDRVTRRAQRGVTALYGLVSLLSLYMTGTCPDPEIIDVALGEGMYLPREVRDQVKRFQRALDGQQGEK